MELKLTPKEIKNSTLACGVAGMLLLIPLAWIDRNGSLSSSWQVITLAGGIFWGTVAILALWLGWKLYYQYFTPSWVRPLAPLDGLLYAGITLGLWWLSNRLPGPGLLWFILLGALEGVLEHLLGIYGMKILDKVPWLKGLPAGPLLWFSFFEYILYWEIVAGLAWLLSRF
jgi:hypothetical protein